MIDLLAIYILIMLGFAAFSKKGLPIQIDGKEIYIKIGPKGEEDGKVL